MKSGIGPVLVVEDPFIFPYIRTLLTRLGLSVMEADAATGAEILQRREVDVRALITNKPALFAGFASDIPLLYTAAFPDESLAAPYECWRALAKPFNPRQFCAEIEDLLAAATVAGTTSR